MTMEIRQEKGETRKLPSLAKRGWGRFESLG